MAQNLEGLAMKGNVIGFDPDTNTGAISGHDGNRYDFATQDWHGHGQPRHGDVVDFQAEGQRATQIYLLEPEYTQPSFAQFYFSPHGRISRKQYWLRFFLPVFVIGLVLYLIGLASESLRMLDSLWQLIVLWPGIAVLVKRIHDRNKSGWLVWALYGPMILAVIFTIVALASVGMGNMGAASGLGIVSGVLWIVTLIVAIWFFIEFGCLRGTIGANRFGPDPVPHG
ncbi:MAG TPA: DUF805 domain-containing protein [Stellaceae bacterium]|nr:DUF805 domain-containing protein [Stellaceae bacterium]